MYVTEILEELSSYGVPSDVSCKIIARSIQMGREANAAAFAELIGKAVLEEKDLANIIAQLMVSKVN